MMMNDNFYWNELWPSIYSNEMEWRGLLVQGKFEDINGNPTCPKCNNHRWYPKLFGNVDVGWELLYTCDCQASMIKISPLEVLQSI